MPGETVRPFLMSLLTGVLKGCPPKTVHQLCDLYERARFSPDSFSPNHLESYRELVASLVLMYKLYFINWPYFRFQILLSSFQSTNQQE